jgi:hypothetical protein
MPPSYSSQPSMEGLQQLELRDPEIAALNTETSPELLLYTRNQSTGAL